MSSRLIPRTQKSPPPIPHKQISEHTSEKKQATYTFRRRFVMRSLRNFSLHQLTHFIRVCMGRLILPIGLSRRSSKWSTWAFMWERGTQVISNNSLDNLSFALQGVSRKSGCLFQARIVIIVHSWMHRSFHRRGTMLSRMPLRTFGTYLLCRRM